MYDYSWTKNLVLSNEFDVFPLQFANTKRIENNDCVFIFDEVGCGKTISAGLMALNYLYNNPEKSVQIITINSLVRPIPEHIYGQFLNDWYEKLPFTGMERKISICNNHCKRIENIKSVGMLIIDEAHLFLEDSQRFENLEKIQAEKVVFLTATPIKASYFINIDKYTRIANKILRKKINITWENVFNSNVPICSSFDVHSPVTRYFKDTVTALDYGDKDGNIHFEKEKVKRLIPQVWEFEGDKKVDKLIDELKMRKCDRSGKKNRFVIFTRYIERESDYIFNLLLKNGSFVKYREEEKTSEEFTVVNLNGTTSEKPTSYSHNGTEKELPDIIIITYQIAEQGLNLPGYNYVINYHISSFPASLEQRFGRIDRMGKKNPSQYDEINMVFLIPENGWDTYKVNFYNAVHYYRNNLITNIPAKNVILTKEILKRYEDDQGIIKSYLEEVKFSINREIVDTYYYLRECNIRDLEMINNDYKNEENKSREDEEQDGILISFCLENDIHIDKKDTISDLKNKIEEELEKCRRRLIVNDKNESDETWKKQVDSILETKGDKIYYLDKNSELIMLDAIKDCASEIFNSDEYQAYVKEFYNQVKIPKLVERYAGELEDYFEKVFLEQGNLEHIFMTPDEYKILFTEKIMAKRTDISIMDKQALAENAYIAVQALPFFKMCREFAKIIHNYMFNSMGWARERYDFHLPVIAVCRLHRMGYIPDNIINSIKGTGITGGLFVTKKKGEQFECSNWLKLFYYCMEDKCAVLFYKFVKKYQELSNCLEREWCELQEEYIRAESIAFDGEEDSCTAWKIYSEILREEGILNYESCEELLFDKYIEQLKELKEIILDIKKHKEKYLGFFDLFFSEEGGKTGKWRKPYWGWTSNWSDILPKEPSGRGYIQIWTLPNEREADFGTYMIFSEIGFKARNRHRTISKDWWLNSFIPNRCLCKGMGEGNEVVQKNIEDYVNRVLL